ncbi:hypothetical protein V8E55_005306 [Tylopilus felleus]
MYKVTVLGPEHPAKLALSHGHPAKLTLSHGHPPPPPMMPRPRPMGNTLAKIHALIAWRKDTAALSAGMQPARCATGTRIKGQDHHKEPSSVKPPASIHPDRLNRAIGRDLVSPTKASASTDVQPGKWSVQPVQQVLVHPDGRAAKDTRARRQPSKFECVMIPVCHKTTPNIIPTSDHMPMAPSSSTTTVAVTGEQQAMYSDGGAREWDDYTGGGSQAAWPIQPSTNTGVIDSTAHVMDINQGLLIDFNSGGLEIQIPAGITTAISTPPSETLALFSANSPTPCGASVLPPMLKVPSGASSPTDWARTLEPTSMGVVYRGQYGPPAHQWSPACWGAYQPPSPVESPACRFEELSDSVSLNDIQNTGEQNAQAESLPMDADEDELPELIEADMPMATAGMAILESGSDM